MQMSKIGILVIDDHQLMREGIELLLASESNFEVVAQAADGRAGLKLVERYRPEIVLLDIGMPEMNGIEACRQIKRLAPEIHVIALSMHTGHRIVKEMLKAGASGYVLKAMGFGEVAQALQSVMAGRRYLSPAIVDVVIDVAVQDSVDTVETPFMRLSSREKELAQLLAEGKTSKEIAFSLNITVRTVDAHKKSIFTKLGISNIAELTRIAVREGMIDSHLLPH